MGKQSKILIIRFSSIGDIVWTTPVIRAVKQQYDHAEVHFCTKQKFLSLVQANPYLDKIFTLNNSLRELIGALKAENYDYIIDLHDNIRTTLIKLALGKKAYKYDKLRLERFLLVYFKINRMPDQHIVERYMHAVSPLGIKYDGKGLDFFIAPEQDVNIEDILPGVGHDFVALIIGASKPTKKLPFFKLTELCERIHKPLILIGGKDDYNEGEQLRRYYENSDFPAIYNACGAFNLSQSASLVKQSSFVVGYDTGLTHIAGAFKKKVYSIWGTTIPDGFKPFETPSVILENHALDCRPCSKSGRKKCPKGHFKCMKELDLNVHFNPDIAS